LLSETKRDCKAWTRTLPFTRRPLTVLHISSRDVLRELRALWENAVSKSGAIGEYVGAAVKTEPVTSGEPVGRVDQFIPPEPVKIQASTNEESNSKRSLEEVEKEEQGEQEEQEKEKPPQKKQHVETGNTQGAVDKGGKEDEEDQQGEDDELGSDLDDSEIDANLNENDDLADVDNLAGRIDEKNVSNSILGLFDRVHRSKSKWKVTLRGCVANINGRDYLFKKLIGDFDFS
jgi:hypothetical protein